MDSVCELKTLVSPYCELTSGDRISFKVAMVERRFHVTTTRV